MRHKQGAQSRWQLKLFVATFATCVIGYLSYIAAYGVNVVFWDDWAWESFLRPGQPTPASLWAQHNENIMFFPNLITYLLIHLTAWNSVAFFWTSAVLLLGVLAVITRVFWGEVKRAPLIWLPLPFIVLTLAQYQNTLWAFQMAWFLVLLSIVGAMFLLRGPSVSTWCLCGAAFIGVVGSYSSLQGLLVWPAGLTVLLANGQSNKVRALWSAVAVVAIAGYFADFKYAETGSAPFSYIIAHLWVVFQGVLITAGSVIPSFRSNSTAIYSPVVTTVVGGFLLIAGMVVVAHWLVQKRPGGPKAFCVALIVTSILFDLLLIPSRLAFDMYAGTPSRYDTFMWPLLLGTYSYVVMNKPPTLSRWINLARAPQLYMAMAMGAAVVVGTIVGIGQGQVSRAVRLTSVDVLANWQDAPPAVSAPYLLPPCGTDHAYCAFLNSAEHLVEADHMSIFSNPTDVRRLRAEGVVPGGVAANPLVVPPILRVHMGSSIRSQRAWDVLSTVYQSNPAFAREYPLTDDGIRRLLLWAVASGRGVNGQTVRDYEWLPPVGTGFFLLQYVSTYQSWASVVERNPPR